MIVTYWFWYFTSTFVIRLWGFSFLYDQKRVFLDIATVWYTKAALNRRKRYNFFWENCLISLWDAPCPSLLVFNPCENTKLRGYCVVLLLVSNIALFFMVKVDANLGDRCIFVMVEINNHFRNTSCTYS